MSEQRADVVAALRSALKDRDRLRKENSRLLAGASEPIAIVGMSCRYPGGVTSPEELWAMLAEGREGIVEFPTDRGWDFERLHGSDSNGFGPSYARHGGFLEAPGDFDPEFFGISPKEALITDPQQRLLLEGAWEALEDAGIDPTSLRGGQAGVYAGVMYQDYGAPQLGLSPGMTTSIVSGRVAYTLGIEGPAVTVDTACSSSLVAIHLAAHALRGGECTLAIVGGVTVLATPTVFSTFSAQRGLSPDGRCKSFAEGADGVGWGEGVGMLVMERLSEAEAKGRTVLATIRGSAVNQDGASNGLTAPNGPAQERVIRQALANARLEPGDVDMVEAHGTGTTLGDPIEAGALLATYGQEREAPLKLGSLKSNLGHTQAAAGVGGVIKAVLAMRAETMPKTLHVDEPSSKVEWETGEIELLTEAESWQPNGRPRRAAVSSFGLSGTNAHVILEQAPPAEEEAERPEASPLSGPVPLLLSAKSEEALSESAARLRSHLEENPEQGLVDTAHSLIATRSAFEHRAVAVGSEREELLESLGALAEGRSTSSTVTARARSGRTAWLLTGQGSQRAGMGRELYETYPAYATALDEALAEIDQRLDRPLRDLLFAEPGSEEATLLDDTTYAQPALFATHVALHRLLESWGLRPDLLTGHSVGEISAAHISGVLSLPDAAKLICARSTLMGALPAAPHSGRTSRSPGRRSTTATGGAMLAVRATEAEALEALEGKEADLSLAAINSPTSVVISGAKAAIEEQEAFWKDKERKTKRLAVSHAFHSPLIEPMQADFAEVTASLAYSEPQIPIVSNLTGELLTTEQATDPAYWVSHVRAPVRFADGVATLQAQGATACVELGPDAVLTAMAAECLDGEERPPVLIPTLREGREEPQSLVLALGSAHASGAKVEWPSFFAGTDPKRVPLPTYPFQRKRYWLSAEVGGGDPASMGLASADHPLLGAAVSLADGEELLLTGRLSLATHPWLADHAVGGAALLPGTAFLELALHAAERLGCEQVSELTLQAPLVLPEQGAVQVQVAAAAPGDDGDREIKLFSRPETDGEELPWTLNAEGLISDRAPATPEPLAEWPPAGAEPLDAESLYDHLAEAGLEYGPAFRGLTAAWKRGKEVFAEVALPEERAADASRFAIHPALLDAALHAIALGGMELGEAAGPALPFSWSEVSVAVSGPAALRVRLAPEGEQRVSISLADAAGLAIGRVGALALRPVAGEQLRAAAPGQGLLGIEWRAHEPAGHDPAAAVETWRWQGAGEDIDPPAAAEAAAVAALETIQVWLARDDRSPEDRLAILTEGAVAAGEGESPDPVQAAIWGLVRSAQAEHPGSLVLIDGDASEASAAALPVALSQAEEPQLALREGAALVPRAVRLAPPDQREVPALDPERTVLITGATGALGALTARHLVAEHGARHLLLASRSGRKADGAKALVEELKEAGAKVKLVACDASDPAQLEALLAKVPKAHPLGAVFHLAGRLDDATVESLEPDRIGPVMAPKARGAWALHESTRDSELSHFVLYASAAGALGAPGQANYAAANSFMDALAQQRRAEGLPATSIAWGLWRAGMGETLAEADLERMRRGGIGALEDEQGLAMLDAALGSARPDALAVAIDPQGLRALAAMGILPPVLSALVRVPKRQSGQGGALARQLAEMSEAEREDAVLALVRSQVADVLGHDSAEAIDPERAFQELGFDSLAALELRNRLGIASGVRLSATVVFDHPTARALATHLLERVSDSGATARVAVRSQASDEPIAIVGMSCRYPGGVTSPEELWAMLAEGREGIGELPRDRGWDVERLYDPDPSNFGTSYTRHGGFLEAPGDFDPEFFAISPKEAMIVDPQQRLLLEGAWEALEDAGVDPATLRGSDAGVYAGVMYQDYGAPQLGLSPGMTTSTVSGRVAYTLGIEGPAMTVDTACSSSLVAMHLAAGALRAGECSLALVGGVTVLATPSVLTVFSAQRGLSPDGRCKSFAEAADGVGWGEGLGMVVMERLSDARAKGHTILAIVRGSAVNQDGASNGLTAPNGPSQERVIRQALANARLEPAEVDMVEAHGTGTTLGDPIEAGALLATYGQERETPLKLGSLKSNLGHTQAAAGVGGVIKAVLAMRAETMPKTLHVDEPSSKVEWETGEIELLTEAESWEPNGRPRRAAVSSFGLSGTNAHVILEEGAAPPTVEATQLDGPLPLTISAKTEEALRESATRLAVHLRENPEQGLVDTAHSLIATRSAFEHRAVAVGGEREELLDALGALAEGRSTPSTSTARARSGRTAWLLTGQGSQRAGMGRELYEAYLAYAECLNEAIEEIDKHLDRPLKDLLFAKPGSEKATLLDDTTYAQPALFATHVALHRLLASWGLTPDLLTGHSVGEISAAHISGVLSLPDAAKLICARSTLMGALPAAPHSGRTSRSPGRRSTTATGGAMLAVQATEAEALEAIEGEEAELSLAAINSPTSVVISGAEGAIEAQEEIWEEKGRKTKRLAVSHAFHSPLIEPMQEAFAEVARELTYNEPSIPIVSNLTGELLTTEQATDPAYWVSHVRAPVRFADGIATLHAQGATTCVELGPDAVLTAMAAECLDGEERPPVLIPTLREGREEPQSLVLALGSAHASGAKVEWPSFFAGAEPKRVPLPTYPFQRKRYWLSAEVGGGDPSAAGQAPADHPLLGAAVPLAGEEGALLTGRLSLATHPWLADHAVGGTVLLPGTAFLELALHAAERVGAEQVAELTLQSPLVLAEQGAVQIQVSVAAPGDDGSREVRVFSRPEAAEEDELPWALNAEGLLSTEAPATPEPLAEWPPEGAEPLEADSLYEHLAEAGFGYGPSFQALTRAWKRGEQVFAEVALSEGQAPDASRFAIHPALLDSALHAIALGGMDLGEASGPLLPFSWSGVSVAVSGSSSLRVRLAPEGEQRVSLTLGDEAGIGVARVGSLALRPLATGQLQSAQRQGLLGIEWHEHELPTGEAEGVETWRWQEAGAKADLPAAAERATAAALEAIQTWLAREDRAPEGRLAILTEGAISAVAGESPDPPAAAIWGLARSAQAEHPGSFVLVDTDGSEESEATLSSALAQAEEPQLALREGVALAPRATRLAQPEPEDAVALDPEKTILVTGATGALGRLTAKHLVEAHGARHLLLASRSGRKADGAKQLVEELREAGAKVKLLACDAADPSQLKELLAKVPRSHPLGAVFHLAGTLDDGTVDSLTPERLGPVLAPKAGGAWALHELTADAELTHFVLYASAAGALGGPGQGNYAAANSFLDALAQRRRTEDRPATSIAWGLWRAGMGAGLSEADLERMRRGGIDALDDERGLAMLDAALASSRPDALAMALDPQGLRALGAMGVLPPVLSSLVRVPRRQSGQGGALARHLSELPEAERSGAVLALVRSQVADVLGHDSAEAIDPEKAFQELGFDSLAALELRNRLDHAAGLRLSATVVFDYPSAQALANHLLERVSDSGAGARVAVRAQASDEPIAIVGMSCRYPGGVGSPEELWTMLAEGREGIGELPTDRGWDVDRLYDPDPSNFGTSYTRHGGFLEAPGEFDPEFFSISPKEAALIDPQQRLLLEGAWEALEDAGVDPASLRGTDAGVYAGVMYQDYGAPALGLSAGMTTSTISGRVAYTLGLEGPAMTVDTACSSSLVAMHLAAGALRAGECSLALVGGVTVLATPTTFIAFSAQRGLSPDGRCKSFAESADGVGWGEGLGMVVLERLSDARARGHTILATVRGSAVNQDGASNGLTAPNGPAQERVIRQALANARLAPGDVDMVEAHGTGTVLGDPIEAGALLATYGQEREAPLKLGSLKSNLGHTQAAAGVGGVIKAVLAMRAETMPRTLHVDAPSSKVEWEAGRIELLDEPAEWRANGSPRRAAVSSFGISGTNAHVILEQGSVADGDEAARDEPPCGPIPLAISAKAEEALRESAARLRSHLEENPEQGLADTAHSLIATRSTFEHRAVAVGSEREELLESLGALAEGRSTSSTATARARSGRTAYLLTGQGSQRGGMGKELYEAYPAYATALDEAIEEIDAHLDRPLKDLLFAEPGSKEAAPLDHTTYAQPALFATHVALHRLLESWGLTPDLLTGHSVGEISAAHISGVLSLPDAAKLICARSTLMGALPAAPHSGRTSPPIRGTTTTATSGAMLAVQATEAEALEAIEGKEAELSLAAINSPTSVVISGAEGAIEAQEEIWEEKGRKTKRLAVSHAFHSPLIEPMQEAFAEVATSLTYNEPSIPIVSNLTGELLTTEQATDPAYWVEHVRAAVRFADGVATLQAQGATACVELGPDAVLTAMVAECLDGEERPPVLIPTLREGREEPQSLVLALGSAHASGAKVEWPSFFAGTTPRRVPLPTYPFQRKRYWLSAEVGGGDPASMGLREADHPLLGAAVEDPASGALALTGRLSLSTHPWLADHAVGGAVLLPGTAFLELALHAAERVGAEQVAELTLQSPMVLPEQGAVQVQVSLSAPEEDGSRQVKVFSRPEAAEEDEVPWALNAEGLLSTEAPATVEPISEWPPEGAEPLDAESLYEHLAEAGFAYGPAFQGLSKAWKHGEEVFAEVALPEERAADASRFAIHPALLDSALHAIGLGGMELGEASGPMLPFSWSEVAVAALGAGAMRVVLSPAGEHRVAIDLSDESGAALARVGSLALRPLSAEQLRAAAADQALLGIEWREHGLAGGEPGEEVEVWRHEPSEEIDPPAAAERATAAALEAIQAWVAREDRAPGARLAIVTEGAVATSAAQSPDPAQAAIWGLARSAQAEHPSSLVLIDGDGSEASEAALPAATAEAVEPQIALREGAALVPRVGRLAQADPECETPAAALDPDRTVLITGATGALGRLTARHLAEAHGARHLLLASRSGLEGAKELVEELKEAGAKPKLVACDAADPAQLEELLAKIPESRPLGAVFHLAGALDDATIETLTPERIAAVLAPKARGAWALHELTADSGLTHFVLYSSAAGQLGGPGQGNYAAANAFLDGLAQRRRAEGLPATSIAWGLWREGMVEALSESDLERMRRFGVDALSTEQGTAMLDAALAGEEAGVLAMALNRSGLRGMASLGVLPPLLSGLVRVPKRGDGPAAGSLLRRLEATPVDGREEALLQAVRAEVAAVLGHDSAEAIDPEKAFQELGFDSLAALELRNRLGIAAGLQLPATAVFDYPSAAALAGYLATQVRLDGQAPAASTDDPFGLAGEGAGSAALIGVLLDRARTDGMAGEFLQVLSAMAPFRPTFAELPAPEHLPTPVRLASGAARPRLICLASAAFMSGPQEYAALARHFEERREVVVLPQAGFAPGDLLPATFELAVEASAEAVRRVAGEEPFVLLGHSTGGLYADAVATLLAQDGPPPIAVVAIDSYRLDVGRQVEAAGSMFEFLLGTAEADIAAAVGPTRLTAMVAHSGLLAGWSPAATAAPTLLLRAGEPAPGMDEAGDWRCTWDLEREPEIPGNHFTTMNEHAATTAEAVERWLAKLEEERED